MTDTAYCATLLPDLVVIEATGADSATFLHGQLSNDITGLPDGRACLAAYCTPKGRMLASFIVWKAHEGADPVYRMLVKQDIAAAIVKRLSMFVLRAKVKLSLATIPVYGVTESASGLPLPTKVLDALLNSPSRLEPYQQISTEAGVLIAAPTANAAPARYWFVPATAETLSNDVAPPDAGSYPSASGSADWSAADIAAGLPWIELATQELFIPQTLNFDLIGGVSFTKGCYPGQEVVARSHYRGTVKRRMAGGVVIDSTLDASTLAGQDTFDAHRPEAPVGRVVNAVTAAGQTHLLLEVQLDDIGVADLRLDHAQGPAVRILDLPYAIQAQQA